MSSTDSSANSPATDPVTTVEGFKKSFGAIQGRVNAAAQRAGRNPDEVRVLPVSKTVPVDRLRLAVEAGITEFGENKVQEATHKYHELKDLDVSWSVIGPLQSNKTKDVAEAADEFQALDRIRIARRLDTHLKEFGRTLKVFVQVNTSGEESKSGLKPEEVLDFLKELQEYDALHVQGLMTLAENTDEEARIRKNFQLLASLRDQAKETDPELIGPGLLSMGMSGDFEIAIEEGANVVRVGQAIFGARDYPA